LSVPCQFVLPLSPPVHRFYRGDNYSDAGGFPTALTQVIDETQQLLVTLTHGMEFATKRGLPRNMVLLFSDGT